MSWEASNEVNWDGLVLTHLESGKTFYVSTDTALHVIVGEEGYLTNWHPGVNRKTKNELEEI